MHCVHVDEKFRKYTTRVEHSFRIANGLDERLTDTITHVNNWFNTSLAFVSLRDALCFGQVHSEYMVSLLTNRYLA